MVKWEKKLEKRNEQLRKTGGAAERQARTKGLTKWNEKVHVKRDRDRLGYPSVC